MSIKQDVAKTVLYELVAEWRARGKKNAAQIHYTYADELEAALPVWTRITEDPETWPGKREIIILTDNDATFWVASRKFSYIFVSDWLGKCWRPLIDGIDTPPKESNDG